MLSLESKYLSRHRRCSARFLHYEIERHARNCSPPCHGLNSERIHPFCLRSPQRACYHILFRPNREAMARRNYQGCAGVRLANLMPVRRRIRAGLLVIQISHEKPREHQRKVFLIPTYFPRTDKIPPHRSPVIPLGGRFRLANGNIERHRAPNLRAKSRRLQGRLLSA